MKATVNLSFLLFIGAYFDAVASTEAPSMIPSDMPSMVPSAMPSMIPSDLPSLQPTDIPATCTALLERCTLNSDCCSNLCRAAVVHGPLMCRALPKSTKTKVGDFTGRGGAAGGVGPRLLRGSTATANGKNGMSVAAKNQREIPEIA